MALSSRERYITLAALAVGSIFALDRLGFSPYLERRKALAERIEQRRHEMDGAKQLLQREQRLRQILTGMGQTLRSDASSVESQLLHLLHQWQEESGVGGASFQRVYTVEEHGFTHLRFQVSATGSMPAVAMLIYRVETAPIPLRVDDVHLLPKSGSGDELQMQLSVSALGKKRTTNVPERGGVTAGVAVTAGFNGAGFDGAGLGERP
jgi:hypothetical protein